VASRLAVVAVLLLVVVAGADALRHGGGTQPPAPAPPGSVDAAIGPPVSVTGRLLLEPPSPPACTRTGPKPVVVQCNHWDALDSAQISFEMRP
jgi:hypothetical protein